MALVFLLPSLACGQSSPTLKSAAESIHEHLGALEEQGFDGVVLLQGQGSVWLHERYGYRDCGGTTRMSINAVFDIGSITKTVTAAAVLRLLEQGRLALDSRLGDLLTDVPGDRDSVTIEELLRHTSGLPEFLGADEEYIGRDDFVRLALATPMEFAPGEGQQYSNVGYSLLAAVIEKVTGRSYMTWVDENILHPATRLPFGYRFSSLGADDFACGTLEGERWGTVADYFGPDGPSWYLMGNGGMMTTAAGLDAWFRSLIGGELLSPPVTDLYIQSVAQESATGGRVIATSGANLIFSSEYVHWLDRDLSLVLLTSDSEWPKERVMPGILERLRPALGDPES